ncbi:hypothetical protein [Photobacterium angustum]|uniref:hypothetical protein n=1 Tax=Photobacterium angustum TaxID=661 RepID=UPI0005E32A29|nr:hypothetical protein [Photobacterium angustum]KJG03255.1 hypothetical protein UB35_00110 [Photobacterium angustum]KJG19064.1 hypothetical protein UA33_03300 [Photobacterium angustum]KJG25246.1 hypothetical protein UA39_04670 [Photobacterium angustum]KJG33554.1 hypothetical protein UA36_00720 [Photobacterium angustum]PSV68142.1 hypothetical protein CTM95_05505 [Photobacterium angustum]
MTILIVVLVLLLATSIDLKWTYYTKNNDGSNKPVELKKGERFTLLVKFPKWKPFFTIDIKR